MKSLQGSFRITDGTVLQVHNQRDDLQMYSFLDGWVGVVVAYLLPYVDHCNASFFF